MSLFFNKFPKIAYDINGSTYPSYNIITDITFRIGVIREVMDRFSAYYEYTIRDGETPEILAEKVYGNAEAHWVILYANEIYDAQYDWPLNERDFVKYITKKYGSIQAAKTGIHHYEKVVGREVNQSGNGLFERFVVDYDSVAPAPNGVPHDTYLSLPVEPSYITYNIDGKTVVEGVARREVTFYDWEREMNEKKRNIKIIKKEYYPQIVQEFKRLTNNEPSYIRKLDR